MHKLTGSVCLAVALGAASCAVPFSQPSQALPEWSTTTTAMPMDALPMGSIIGAIPTDIPLAPAPVQAATPSSSFESSGWLTSKFTKSGTTWKIEVTIGTPVNGNGPSGSPLTAVSNVIVGVFRVDPSGKPVGDFIPMLPTSVTTAFVAGAAGPAGVFEATVDPSKLASGTSSYVPACKATIVPGVTTGSTLTDFALAIDANKKQGGFYSKSSPLASLKGPPAEYWGKSLGRFTYGFHVGAIFSEGRNSFSEKDIFIRFRGDTVLGEIDYDTSPKDCLFQFDPHTSLDLSLTSVPVPDATQTFVESKKAFSGAIGLDINLLRWHTMNNYQLRLGPSFIVGMDTAESSAGGSNVRDFWGAGIKVSGGLAPTRERPNPLPRHYAAIYRGDFDDLGAKRIFTDMGLILSEELGFFVGVQSNSGSGSDDVRVIFGFTTHLEEFFKGIRALLPSGLR